MDRGSYSCTKEVTRTVHLQNGHCALLLFAVSAALQKTLQLNLVIRDLDVRDNRVKETPFTHMDGHPIFPINLTSFVVDIGCRR